MRSAEPAGGSADAEMVDERDTSTWPAVLQVTVRVAVQVLCLVPWQGGWIIRAAATTDNSACTGFSVGALSVNVKELQDHG